LHTRVTMFKTSSICLNAFSYDISSTDQNKFGSTRPQSSFKTHKLSCHSRFQRAFTTSVCVFKVIKLAWKTKVFTLKIQTHAVNARWKRLSQLRFRGIQIIRDTFLAYFRPPLSHMSLGDTGLDLPPPPIFILQKA